jgi:hypothetical protein
MREEIEFEDLLEHADLPAAPSDVYSTPGAMPPRYIEWLQMGCDLGAI